MSQRAIKVPLKQLRKSAMRQVKRLKEDAATRAVYVTVAQDEITKQVYGVLIHRNAYDKFRDKCVADGIDLSHTELIDFEITVP